MNYNASYLKLIFLIFLLFFLGCKTKTNQIVNHQREGKWITVDTLDYVYITKGKYKKGKEKGTWKYLYNGKVVRKERYKNGICHAYFYYPNGKIMKRGYTKLDSNDTVNHWYYYGKWYCYNKNGILTTIKTYEKGKIIDSLIVRNASRIKPL
ncbi:hypothetical protein [Flavobacterium aestivum]|uniref:hypothetical protein n=1 Tax=Flavobacterium aestivum TaxID=3003257 RepID=UPI0024829621|nr:hypothetical protein [Flavobacterium aestivum]